MYPCRGGPCGGSEVCRIHVGAQKHTPPRHPAGMNDCPRGRGAHCERAVQVVRGRFAHCGDAVQVLHSRFTHYDGAVQVLHGRFTHCDDAVQVLHSRFTHCDGAAQVLHDRFTHCDGPRDGAYAIRPYPGTRGAYAFAPLHVPGQIRRRPQTPRQTSLASADAPDARRRLHLRAFHSKYSQR